MSNGNALIIKALGLNTQPNELSAPEGSLSVAENVEINRDGVVQVASGFEDYSTNLPDFEPQQLFAFGGVVYAHLDDGWWYYDTSDSRWYRKRGTLGGKFSSPTGITYVSGHLYITNLHAVMDLELSTGQMSVLAGRQGVSGTSDGTGAAATFNDPRGIVSDGAGNLYVCDSGNHSIRKIVISTGAVTTFAGLTGTSGTSDGTGGAARFNTPYGIAYDGSDLYVTDNANFTIRKITSGAVVTTFAGTAGATGSADGTGAAARFDYLYGIAYDSASTALYACDGELNSSIRKVTVPGAVVTTISGADGIPVAILNANGTLYVSTANELIQKLTLPSTFLTIAGDGVSGSDDGPGASASFFTPEGIAYDGSDLFVCDYSNGTIRKIYLSNNSVVTVTGDPLKTAAVAAVYADSMVIGPD